MIGFLILLVSIILSAFFSGSETALISARRIKLEVWIRNNVRGAKSAYNYIQHPEKFLTTTLVGTNIAVVTASSFIALYLQRYFNGFIITVISSTFLLLFGEILPKCIARERATTITLYVHWFLRGFYILFFPLIIFVLNISHLLLKIVGTKEENVKWFFSRKDIDMLVREGRQIGLVDDEKQNLISRLILRGNQKVRDVMIPRTEIVAVKKSDSISKVSEIFANTGLSRLPVIGKDIDHIEGIVTVKDVILKKPANISEVIRDLMFVPDTQIIARLLTMMRNNRTSIAIVVDEYGGTAGLITLEDIIEEFFGEIHDEFDEVADIYGKITPTQIDVDGRVSVDELNERFSLNLPEGDYNTLSGLMMKHLGHIPQRGERVEFPDCTLMVLKAYLKRVGWVRILRGSENRRG